MSRYKPVGWRGESQRHSLARKGIKTANQCKNYKVVGAEGKNIIKDKKILNEIESVFNNIEKDIEKSISDNPDEMISLTYGMIPVFRDWFSSELDEKYMYSLSDDGIEEVNFMFEELENNLSKKGIMLWGSEGDGTVIFAGTEEVYNKYFGDEQ